MAAASTAAALLLLAVSASLRQPPAWPPGSPASLRPELEAVAVPEPAAAAAADDPFNYRRDVLVLVHVQKTGGSHLNRQLVSNLRQPEAIRCQCGGGGGVKAGRKGRAKGHGGGRKRKWRCSCRDGRGNLWLVSRYSTGWLCGLHADFAALAACAPDQLAALDAEAERPRRLRFVTMLRRPADRFLSEWQHARRGATWRKSQPSCLGRRPRPCRSGDAGWRGASLAEFAACRANPALNRQARMLANASRTPCRTVLDSGNRTADLLLVSAMQNLVGMAAFGLTEWQILTQYLLSRRLGLTFNRLFWQSDATVASHWQSDANQSGGGGGGGGTEILQQRLLAESANPADARLYAAGERLFFGQARRLLAREPLLTPAQRSRVRIGAADAATEANRLTSLARQVLLELGAVEVDDAEKADIRRRLRKKLLAGEDDAVEGRSGIRGGGGGGGVEETELS